MKLQELLDKEIDAIGDDHVGSNNEETPLKEGAFDIPDPEKISLIQKKVYEILDILGMDLTDDSLKGTPRRVAKMFRCYTPHRSQPPWRQAGCCR